MIASTASDWLGTSAATLALVALTTAILYLSLLVMTRISGLRSFAQMSAFDLVMTIAVGSVFATTAISAEVSVPEGATALVALFGLQALVAVGRLRSPRISRAVDNQPLLVAAQGEIFAERLAEARLTHNDLYAKLREANVRNIDEVFAVVVETTGDVPVIHGDRDSVEFDPVILGGVLGGDVFES